MTRPALITAAVVGLCAALLAGASTAGAATEYFASPDETRTTQDCGTRARACALGVAVRRPTSADDTVVVLAGSYDLADINAGAAPGSEPGQLELVPGTTLSGDLDGPVPTISSAAASGAPTIALTRNTLRWLRVERGGSTGAAITGQGGPANPAVLDRVVVVSSGEFGVSLVGTAALRNSFVTHTGPAGAAIRLDASARPSNPAPQPRALGITARSTVGDALQLVATGNDPQEVTVTNTALAGPVRLSATATSGIAGTLTLKGDRSAYPAGSPIASGPVVQQQTGSVAFSDGMLAADGLPSDGSALIDGGVEVAGLGPVDLAGRPRIVGAAPDIGALERQDRPRSTPSPTPDPGLGGATDPFEAFGPEPDTLAPWLDVTSSVRTLSRKRLAAGLTIKVTTDEPATAKLELLTSTRRKGKTTERVVGSVSARAAAAGELRLKLKIASKRLPKAGTKATLRFTLTDLAGNATSERRTTKIS